MEVSFGKEIESLRLGAGQTFHGEGILAITKALLQSGVSYVGGYQGAPISHLLDVMVQAKPYMDELGVHVEACANEASAAAMLGASIHYPLRGAVTWKSIVGTNVASDALSNLSSPGVKGGALIVVGEDYGEGASVIQERTHAYALKSSMCLLDPRPDLGVMVRMVEEGFRLSETSNMPCILELRIRACHVRGSFEAKDNQPPAISTRALMENPAGFDYMKLAHPPVTFRHEKLKGDERIPAARRYIAENHLNELMPGKHADLGIVVQGGLYNSLIRSLQQLGLANAFGESDIPLLVLNVTYPLVPEQVADFCVGKRAVLVVEEGQPEYIEQDIATLLRRRDIQTPLHGKDLLPAAGEYSVEVVAGGLLKFWDRYQGSVLAEPVEALAAPSTSSGRTESAGDGLSPLPHGAWPLGRAIAQLQGIYILAENDQGLVIVDMHAAHERIVYERLKLQMDTDHIASQPLLIPATFAATPQEIATAEGAADTLQALGLEITPFSAKTLAVRAVPTSLAQGDAVELAR
ncbi:MAG: Indolepyruvate ferredoxin oxidoreductase, partial [Ramlibacter sp.]|nr:Indolepyruvate ferredoxin oxidoreductase [Ramlibacter sp.]